MALGVNGTPGGPSGIREKKLSSIKKETNDRLAKMAGKTGKVAISEWMENVENGIEKKISPRRKPPRRLSPIKREVSSVVGDSTSGAKKTKKDTMKNVRFVPLKETTNGIVSGPREFLIY